MKLRKLVAGHVSTAQVRPFVSTAGRMFLLVLSLSGLTGLVTSALFTDTETNATNTFSTNAVDLVLGSTTTFITMGSMLPGDRVVAPLTVSNPTGKAPFRYSVKSTTTEATLASQLTLTIKTGVTACTFAGFASTGTSAYTGILGTTAPGQNIIGDSTTGAQAGDRTLAPGATETLCFQVQLPASTTNTYANMSTAATFTFDAEQTTNNP